MCRFSGCICRRHGLLVEVVFSYGTVPDTAQCLIRHSDAYDTLTDLRCGATGPLRWVNGRRWDRRILEVDRKIGLKSCASGGGESQRDGNRVAWAGEWAGGATLVLFFGKPVEGSLPVELFLSGVSRLWGGSGCPARPEFPPRWRGMTRSLTTLPHPRVCEARLPD